MSEINNASISYFTTDSEVDVLVYMYTKLYELSLDFDNLTVLFIDLTGNMDTITIYDLNHNINYGSYSEYSDYSLNELEDQIYMVYSEFYKKNEPYDPIVIMIHDATKMPDCADEYELLEYLNDKLSLLKVLRTYIFCTVKH